MQVLRSLVALVVTALMLAGCSSGRSVTATVASGSDLAADADANVCSQARDILLQTLEAVDTNVAPVAGEVRGDTAGLRQLESSNPAISQALFLLESSLQSIEMHLAAGQRLGGRAASPELGVAWKTLHEQTDKLINACRGESVSP